jgi:hypothetical protein
VLTAMSATLKVGQRAVPMPTSMKSPTPAADHTRLSDPLVESPAGSMMVGASSQAHYGSMRASVNSRSNTSAPMPAATTPAAAATVAAPANEGLLGPGFPPGWKYMGPMTRA